MLAINGDGGSASCCVVDVAAAIKYHNLVPSSLLVPSIMGSVLERVDMSTAKL